MFSYFLLNFNIYFSSNIWMSISLLFPHDFNLFHMIVKYSLQISCLVDEENAPFRTDKKMRNLKESNQRCINENNPPAMYLLDECVDLIWRFPKDHLHQGLSLLRFFHNFFVKFVSDFLIQSSCF